MSQCICLELIEHSLVLRFCDVVLYNAYPFWEGVAVERAVARLDDSHRRMLKAAAGKPVWVSETGWPTSGQPVGNARPSLSNSVKYFGEVTSWARANDVPYLYFSAYDEPWKALYEGDRGAFWGLWNRNEELKARFFGEFAGPW